MPMFASQFFPFPEGLEFVEVVPQTRVTAAGDTESEWIDLSRYEGNVALLLHAAEADAGTNPALSVAITHRVNAADTPAAIPATSLQDGEGNNATFGVVTAAANGGLQVLALIRAELRAQIKVTVNVAGTSNPTFRFAMSLLASNKYGAF